MTGDDGLRADGGGVDPDDEPTAGTESDEQPTSGADVDPEDLDLETVRVQVGRHGDRVATVVIDRPEARNAMNAAVRRDLKAALGAAEADDGVRVVVLTGSEESRSFVAGADVEELLERDAVDMLATGGRQRVYETVDDLTLPVIARIDGYCLGGGNELALACDVRLASPDATLGQPEITLGIMPGGGATQRLPRLVGEGQAMRLVLSGELLDAEEAAEIGLVDEVCPDLDERVTELAGRMADHGPIALAHAKKAVKAGSRMDLEAGLDYETELFAALFATEDKNEGIRAFLEDREPEFEGR